MWAAFAAGTLVLLHPAAIEGQAGQEPPGAYTVAATAASTAPLDPNFDELGRNSYRDGGGYLPFEHIDPFTGNVLLTFVDAVLPGNAGLDLVLARTYNSKVYAEYATLTIPEDSWAGVGWRLHVVNQILSDFKAGRRSAAEFWIDFAGKQVHIRYFPVRDKKGQYLGCLEVVQDVTGIKALKGERRLLDA